MLIIPLPGRVTLCPVPLLPNPDRPTAEHLARLARWRATLPVEITGQPSPGVNLAEVARDAFPRSYQARTARRLRQERRHEMRLAAIAMGHVARACRTIAVDMTITVQS